MSEQQIDLSNKLAYLFPKYINTLGLKNCNDELLTLNEEGNGSFKEYIKRFIIKSAQEFLNKDNSLEEFPFIKIKDDVVIDIDFDEYVKYQTRMKVTPAFDGLDLNTAENDLFGDKETKDKHFTHFGFENSKLNGQMADGKTIKLLNPMSYIDGEKTTLSKHWRIRHGAIDSDTSVAISAILSTTLKNKGFDVDYAVPWGVPHSGDYDLDELFAWMEKISK